MEEVEEVDDERRRAMIFNFWRAESGIQNDSFAASFSALKAAVSWQLSALVRDSLVGDDITRVQA